MRTSTLRGQLADFTKDKRTADQGRCTCVYGPVHKERKSQSIYRQVNYKQEVNQAVNTEFLAEWKETELLEKLKAGEATCLLLFWLFVKSAVKTLHVSV